MTDIDIDDIEQKARAAQESAPGPWDVADSGVHVIDMNFELCATTYARPDAAYIAAVSPDVALALIARLRKAEAVAGFWEGDGYGRYPRKESADG